jgi:DNA repair exonuclease SbcCD nuclease subunit
LYEGSIPRPRRAGAAGDILVVHSSDVHVDNEYTARSHAGEGTGGLRSVIATARRLQADLLLLAGDTFECHVLPLPLLQRTAEILRAAEIPIVILPGNHDPAVPEAVYYRGGLTDVDNVHIIGVTHGMGVDFPTFDLEVWGRPHCDWYDMEPLAEVRPRRTRWQIAMAHGHYDPGADRTYRPRPAWLIDDEEIAATGADYLALGHWNRPVRVGNCRVPAYYSGSPEYAGTVNLVRLKASGGVLVTREKILWDHKLDPSLVPAQAGK